MFTDRVEAVLKQVLISDATENFLEQPSPPGTVTFSGLNAGASYQVILYSGSDTSGREGIFTVDGSVVSSIFQTNVSTFQPGVNYVAFDATADSGGNLEINFDAPAGSEADLNGIQLRPLTSSESPTQLQFDQQPTNLVAGSYVMPPVTVDVEDSADDVITSDNSIVNLTALLNGSAVSTLSAMAVNGVATFKNILLNTPGSYVLTATDAETASSTAQSVTINASNGVPSISAINPISVVAGGSDFLLTVTGTEFNSTTLVDVNGSTVPTTLVFDAVGAITGAVGDVPASDIATTGSLQITVENPMGGISSADTLKIHPAGSKVSITQNSGGTVTAMGTNTSGTSSITTSNGMVVLNINGVTQTFSMNSVTGINVVLGDGDDSVGVGSSVPSVSVFGGTGNDTIIANNSSPDTLHGGSGDNYEVGGSGADMLKGGKGRDTIAAMGSGTTVNGGAGDDLILDGSGSGDSINGGAGLNFAQYNPNNTQIDIFEVFDPPKPSITPSVATPSVLPLDSSGVTAAVENDILVVTGAPGSNKMIVTLSGSNLEVTSNGDSIGSFAESSVTGVKIIAGPDNDTLHVNASVTLPATLKGGAGDDKLLGGSGENVLNGGTGNSILKAGAGVSLLVPGRRTVFSSSGPQDTLIGGSGLSIADFSHRTDPLFLSNDNNADSGDRAEGEAVEIMSNVSAIWGGTGPDTIVGTTAGEFLSGGAGKNTVHGGGATDVLIGGDGKDTVVAAAEPVSLYLDLNKPGEYGGISNAGEDVLQINTELDTLIPS
jgi:Ca2+-binding RTX toxin-like protein